MKHRRSIDLAPSPPVSFREFDGHRDDTIGVLKEWEKLGARCGKCGKAVWLDKNVIVRRYGDQNLKEMGKKLRCTCGNRDGNRVLIGKLGRD